MSSAVPHRVETFRDADPALQPLVDTLNTRLKERPVNLPATKAAMLTLLEFLSSPEGRTDANCRAVDGFFFHDDNWTDAGLPDAYRDVFAHMDALHDTIRAADIGKNFDSTPEKLLERVRGL